MAAISAPASGLAEITQDSFAAGMVRNGVREAIPASGAFDLSNYLIQDDEKIFRRGGSSFKSTASAGTKLYWVHDGWYGAGQRTLFGDSLLHAWVLGADDTTPAQLFSTISLPTGPIAPVKVANWLVIPHGNVGSIILYAGSRKVGDNTGLVSISTGSRILTGVGTSWTTVADAGMLVTIGSISNRYVIQSVDSNTQITLDRVFTEAGVGGVGYAVAGVAGLAITNTLGTPTVPYKLASVANRLAYSAGSQVGLSDPILPMVATSGNYLQFGGTVLGMVDVHDVLLVCTTAGTYAVSGLASSTPSDPAGNAQWRRELVNAELILLSHEGIAKWHSGAILPCMDGVWLVDSVSSPRLISRNISDLYLSYVRTSGYKTGVAAIFNNRYFLPILDSSNAVVDCLVCDLRSQAWTHLAGSGAQITGFAARGGTTPPLLLGAATNTNRLLSLPYSQPSASVKTDHDGTAHVASITTRDFMDGDQPTLWKKLRVVREGTVDSGSPTVSVTAQRPSDGSPQVMSGGASDSTTQTALSDGTGYFWWAKSGSGGTGGFGGRQIRYTITTAGALSTWVLHKLSVFLLRQGRQ